ncbi:MAG: sulfatase-like hydrolase/transferase [Polyangiaceae bacterium]
MTKPSEPRTRLTDSLRRLGAGALLAVAAASAPACQGQNTAGDVTDEGVAVGASQDALATNGTVNVLFIVADDVGVDNISGYGEHTQSASTDNIDSLADSGVLFRNAWVNPMCSPSRASLYTGRHAFRHGVLHPSEAEMDPSEETIAEVMHDAGYATALFGKWHLGSEEGSRPTEQGFDYFSGSLPGSIDDYFSWTKTQMTAGSSTQTEVTETGYATSVNVSEAETWIAAQTSPWMVTLTFNAGHSPYHVPPSSLHNVALTGSEGDACGSGADPIKKCYRAMVEAMDSEIGNLLSWLDTEGELDNTLVVFIGDNGTPGNVIVDQGSFSSTHGKSTVYEGGVNVPLIVYGPSLGIQQGVEIDSMVQGLDVFATLVDVSGGSSSSGITIDSQSLVDYLVGNTVTNERTYLYTELYKSDGTIDRWAITDYVGKYLNIEGTEECYNLNLDAGETVEKYASGGNITNRCNSLKTQRPCESTSECPGE